MEQNHIQEEYRQLHTCYFQQIQENEEENRLLNVIQIQQWQIDQPQNIQIEQPQTIFTLQQLKPYYKDFFQSIVYIEKIKELNPFQFMMVIDCLNEDYETTFQFGIWDSFNQQLEKFPVPQDIESLDLSECSIFVKRINQDAKGVSIISKAHTEEQNEFLVCSYLNIQTKEWRTEKLNQQMRFARITSCQFKERYQVIFGFQDQNQNINNLVCLVDELANQGQWRPIINDVYIERFGLAFMNSIILNQNALIFASFRENGKIQYAIIHLRLNTNQNDEIQSVRLQKIFRLGLYCNVSSYAQIQTEYLQNQYYKLQVGLNLEEDENLNLKIVQVYISQQEMDSQQDIDIQNNLRFINL